MSDCIQSAMILAAGLGTRMRPLTNHTPKPLVEVAGKPLIAYALSLLQEAAIERVVINTHYLAEQLRDYIVTIGAQESYEEALLETGGGICRALPLLGEQPFVALNSDTICLSGSAPVLSRMAQMWDADAMDMLLLLMPKERAIGYDGAGDFVQDAATGRFRRRRADEADAPYVFTGVQLLKPSVFEQTPDGAFSMNLVYNRQLDADGWFERVGFLVHDGQWLHVGDPAARDEAEAFIHTLG